jgi:hypothetical protein
MGAPRLGCPSGDTGGDLTTRTPATVSTAGEAFCSPERFSGSHFWMLQADDDEDEGRGDGEEDGDGDGVSSAGVGGRSASYLWRTP